MKTLTEWLRQNKELCEQLPPGKLAVDYDKRSCGADQIILADGPCATVAFMSTGWNRDDPDDNTNPFAEFFVASRMSLPQALRIIEAIRDRLYGDGIENGYQFDEIAEAIISETEVTP